jgi:predicted component of type VI protein secretion system
MSACPPTSSDCPKLLYVDPTGAHRAVTLAGHSLVTLGRRPEADVCLPWDPEISRLHAELLQRGGEWIIVDDGLSQNGTLVNGLPVEGRRRLNDGDHITVGRTTLTFCDPRVDGGDGSADVTLALGEMQPIRTYSEQQQQVLRAFCRPLLGDGEGVTPASDEETAAALGLPAPVVARELDALAASFGFAELPLAERRVRTALSALRSGLVSGADS